MHPKLVDLQNQLQRSTLTPVFSPLLEQKKIQLWIKRDDLIHPVISGNKWRKLKYILEHALMLNAHCIVSMGGAYSNHLHALAYVGKQLNLKTRGFVRGERPKDLNLTLQDIIHWGMELNFISRSEYRNLRSIKKYNELPDLQQEDYWLPEGGSTELALLGVKEIVSELDVDFDVICVPCGTATTLAGLVRSTPTHSQVIGFAALRGAGFLTEDVKKLLKNQNLDQSNWSIQLDYHFGGFAKYNNELLLFMESFVKQHSIELDPVYTGKMLFGVFDLVRKDYFKPGQKIIAIHTGGLQGNRKIVASQ